MSVMPERTITQRFEVVGVFFVILEMFFCGSGRLGTSLTSQPGDLCQAHY